MIIWTGLRFLSDLTWRICYREQELLILHEHLASSPWFFFIFLVGCVLLLFLALYDILLLSLSSFCVLYRMLPESLDCPFLIVSSVFSNDHLYKVVKSCKTHASRIQTTHIGKTQQLRNYLF